MHQYRCGQYQPLYRRASDGQWRLSHELQPVYGLRVFQCLGRRDDFAADIPGACRGGRGFLSVPIYAKLPGGQTSVSTVGNADTQYQELYGGTSVDVEVQTGLLVPSLVNCPLLSPGWTLNIPLTVKALVQKNCTISATNLVFPAQGLLSAAVPGSSQISVQCTNNNAYSLALNGGTVAGNVMARRMKHATASDTVSYQLYQGGDYAVVWGDASGGSPKTGLGSGTVQNHTVYGRVPASPRPGRAATAIPSRPPSHSEPAHGGAIAVAASCAMLRARGFLRPFGHVRSSPQLMLPIIEKFVHKGAEKCRIKAEFCI